MTTVTTEIRPTTVRELREVAAPLILEHWREVGPAVDVKQPHVDWTQLQLLDDQGRIVALAAWHGDDLAGYSVGILSTHTHDLNDLCLINDSFFVADEYRPGGAGMDLMRATEAAARDAGANHVLWCAPVGGRLERLLDGLRDYWRRETVFCKELN